MNSSDRFDLTIRIIESISQLMSLSLEDTEAKPAHLDIVIIFPNERWILR